MKCLYCGSNAEYVGLSIVEGCENSSCKAWKDDTFGDILKEDASPSKLLGGPMRRLVNSLVEAHILNIQDEFGVSPQVAQLIHNQRMHFARHPSVKDKVHLFGPIVAKLFTRIERSGLVNMDVMTLPADHSYTASHPDYPDELYAYTYVANQRNLKRKWQPEAASDLHCHGIDVEAEWCSMMADDFERDITCEILGDMNHLSEETDSFAGSLYDCDFVIMNHDTAERFGERIRYMTPDVQGTFFSKTKIIPMFWKNKILFGKKDDYNYHPYVPFNIHEIFYANPNPGAPRGLSTRYAKKVFGTPYRRITLDERDYRK